MDSSKKQEFTRRISQCNKGELIVIMYDIVFTYMDEAKEYYEKNDYESYKTAVKNAQETIQSLIGALDFKYDLSKELQPLYTHCYNSLAKSIYQNRLDGIAEAEDVLKRLYNSFCEAAKTDKSGPLMRNTQRVYAGMTYGRNSLNENIINDNHRGFLV